MKTKIISILALLLTMTQGAWAASPTGEIRALDWQNGSIYVAGWAYDPDAESTSINVDYYIYTTSGNPGSSKVKSGRLLANGSNSHSWYSISGNHEFSGHIDLTGVAAGTYYICIYGLDTSGSGNDLIPGSGEASIYTEFSITVYNPYTVALDRVGGTTGSTSVSNVRTGFAMPSTTMPTSVGYTFVGYFDQSNGQGTKYYNADGSSAHVWNKREASNSATATLYAHWTANTYSVRFNKNADDATGTMDNEAFTYDEAKALTANTFSRTGYTFDGWATTADGAVAYTDGQSVSNLTATDGATVDLYAHWTCNTATSGIDWNPSTNSGTFLMPAYNVEVSTELWYKVDEEKTLDENIAAYGGKSDFFLNRTLTANVWNTFASPFAIAAGDMTKYFGAGAKVRQLSTTSVAENVLTLNFTDATEIVAGQPYLVKPAANVDFSADGKEFAGVDLTAATPTATETDYVNFVPTLGKTAVTGDVKDILILNASGTLVHPSAVGNMKGFRGYFVMHDAPANANAFVINFGEGETTGIQPIRMENGTTPAEGTYDLSGRRIQGQPTQKGVYIQNGKKVVIK